jgi:hypothetical protein
MEKYSIASQKLQDIAIKTVRLTAKAGELGAVTATTITIPLADISSDAIAAADVLVANNITEDTAAVASISGTNLVLTDTAIAATDLIDLVIRLK